MHSCSALQRSSLLAFCVLGLSACEQSVSLNLAVTGTDAVSGVVLPLEAIHLLDDGGGLVSLAPATTIDQNLIGVASDSLFPILPESDPGKGNYTGLALDFDEHGASVTQADGTVASVYVPDASLYADMALAVEDNTTAMRIVVLDLRFSLSDQTSSIGSWYLRPYYRVVDPDSAGSFSGTVDSAIITSSACRDGRALAKGVAVYAFSGSGVTPRDFAAGAGINPVASAQVGYDASSSAYTYDLPYLNAGDYTLALTCEGDAEDALLEQGLGFQDAQDASITAGSATTVDFP